MLKPSQKKRCIIISETNLGCECGDIWVKKGGSVSSFITNHEENIKWALKNNVPHYTSIDEFKSKEIKLEFEYLFSIANDIILKADIIESARIAAINFHDSLLPKYAGLYSTSWAIINGETSHGITWHMIESGIDTGDILLQKRFEIDEKETAFSLNLKCFTQAIQSFYELTDALFENKVSPRKQAAAERIYYCRSDKPKNHGLISWDMPAEEIDRIFRALSFEHTPNKLCTLKIHISNSIYIPKKITLTSTKSETQPGTINLITDSELVISTSTNDIKIHHLKSLSGKAISMSQLTHLHSLYDGYQIESDPSLTKKIIALYENHSKYEAYWYKQIKNASPVYFPCTINFSDEQSDVIYEAKSPINLSDIAKEANDAGREKHLLNCILTALSIYTHQTTGLDQFTIGYESEHQSQNELSPFVLTEIPINIQLSDNDTVNFTAKTLNDNLEKSIHKKHPLLDIIERMPDLKEEQTHYPISVRLLSERNTDKKTKKTNGVTVEINPYTFTASVNWITRSQHPLNQDISDSISKSLSSIIKQADSKRQLLVKQTEIISQNEKELILDVWNNTHQAFSDKQIIPNLLEKLAASQPDKVAIVYQKQTMTYQQLNHQANQLAHLLQNSVDDLNAVIAVCFDRSFDLVISLFAILKAGLSYLPLEPNLPDKRLAYMLEDTKAKIILTNSSLAIRFSDSPSKLIKLDEVDTKLSEMSKKNLNIDIDPGDTAYITYTSGSTGLPKGVVCNHLSVMNRLSWAWYKYPFLPNETCTLQSSIAFVDSTWDIFGTLLNGGRLVLYPRTTSQDVIQLAEEIFTSKITRLTLVPSFFKVFSQMIRSNKTLLNKVKTLRHIEITGEQFDYDENVQKFIQLFNNKLAFLDCYGATEATSVIYRDFSKQNNHCTHITANTKVYILTQSMQFAPINIPGEIYIGGLELADGYLNREELTKERFIYHSLLPGEKPARLYKTGDLAKWSRNGHITFLGRKDNQIKIRGHRIELQEIEFQIEEHPQVQSGIVIGTNRSENSQLIAYIVLKDQSLKNKLTTEIKQHLESVLPEYMIPSHFIYIDEIPLNNNGKRDLKALPKLNTSRDSTKPFKNPTNKHEKIIRNAWAKILELNAEEISVTDTFSEWGGNSITAIKLSNEIISIFSTNIPVISIFENNTIEKLSRYVKQNDVKALIIPKASKNKEKKYPLSFSQERLWFIEKYEDGTHAYNIPMVFELSKDIDLKIIKKCLYKIVKRHEILRTQIKEDAQGNSFQYVTNIKELSAPIDTVSVNNHSELLDLLKKDAHRFYDLSSEPPFFSIFYHCKETSRKYLSIVIHHIACDGWSEDILMNELFMHYNYFYTIKLGHDIKLNLPTLPIQYKDFSVWQRENLHHSKLDDQLNYWKENLKNIKHLDVLADKKRPEHFDYKGADIHFEIDEGTSLTLRTLAKKMNVSLYTLLLSAYTLMLKVYSNQDDVILGTSSANRHFSQLQNMIGFFVNTLPIRIPINSNQTLLDLIKLTHIKVLEAQFHQDIPFEKIVDTLDVEKDQSRHPIFQIMFEVQSFGQQSQNQINSPYIRHYKPAFGLYQVAKFDINTVIDDGQPQLKGKFNYATSIYNETTIQGYIETYKHILEQFCTLLSQNKHAPISKLSYLSPEKYQLIVRDWNNTKKNFPLNKSLACLFEEQARRFPNNIAVISEQRKMTYQELNSQANQLARYLISQHQIGEDTLTMIIMDRDIEFLILMLAIFKAGAAYIPIDPVMPTDRISSIIEESKPILIAISDNYTDLANNIEYQPNNIFNINKSNFSNQKTTDLNLDVAPNSLAYIIYTSGSTGRPKGAMIEYKGMINHLYIKVTDMKVTEHDVVAQTASQSFDVSVWQFLTALMVGGTTVVFKGTAAWNPDELLDIMSDKKVTIFQTVPSHMYGILPEIENSQKNAKKLSSLRWLMINGEPLPSEICNRWFQVHPSIPIINAYGPTECSDDVTHYKIYRDTVGEASRIMPISGTLANTQIYITDNFLNPVPIGAIGELCVGGVGVGRGYLKRPELTAEKFVYNPFANQAYKDHTVKPKLYKTGDLVRYLPNGEIEYISRRDFQVKIRGYRIELGEIEAALLKHESITQTTVVALSHESKQPSTKYLAAYYVSDEALEETSLIEVLKTTLPEYMVPAAFIHIEALPLTLSGKIDRKALPTPTLTHADSYMPPRTSFEEKISNIWAEVLGLSKSKVSINDDFFQSGGDSIISIQLVTRLRQQLQAKISVKDIFTYRTIARLAPIITRASSSHALKTEKGLLSGNAPLLPIQEWFFEKHFPAINHYNQAFIIKTPTLDIKKLKTALSKLIDHHDAFRLRYDNENQTYDKKAKQPDLRIIHVEQFKESDMTDWQSQFNIYQGPIASFTYIHGLDDNTARIHIACHHLIIDTVSWRILCDDLQALYEGKALQEKSSSYRQWAECIEKYAHKNVSESKYWEKVLADYIPKKAQKVVPQYTTLKLDNKATSLLLKDCHKAYNTNINDILLTALAISLRKLNHRSTNHIVLEGHGREEIDEDIDVSRTMGWFTSLYPVRLHAHDCIIKTLKSIKESLRSIPQRGIGYGAIVGYKNKLFQLPQVCFNYLGQLDQTKSTASKEWKIVNEPAGNTLLACNDEQYLLNINSKIIDGCFEWTTESTLSTKITREFNCLFEETLADTIKELSQTKRTYLTPSDINYITNEKELELLQKDREIESIFLANSLQQGFIYHSLSQGSIDDAYLVQMIWQYNSAIQPQILKKAWEIAQKKFAALRLRFSWNQTILQIIDKSAELHWHYSDLSHLTSEKFSKHIKMVQQKDRLKPYDLSAGSLFRIYIFKENEKSYRLLFSNHHAILDGWSNQIMFSEVNKIYISLMQNHNIRLEENKNYERTQKYLQSHDTHEEFWKSYLDGINNSTDLNGLLKPEARKYGLQLHNYKHIKSPRSKTIVLKNEHHKQLKETSALHGVTTNVILQYVWHKILNIYGNCEHTVVGTIFSGRDLPVEGIENSVGLHINTLPLAVHHDDNNETIIIDKIKCLQENLIDIQSKANSNLATLQKNSERVFDSLFIFENYPEYIDKNDDLNFTFEKGFEKIDYPLGLLIFEKKSELTITLQYDAELFNGSVIENLLDTIGHLLDQISHKPTQHVKDLEYLSKSNYKKVYEQSQGQKEDYSDNESIITLFEKQSLATPNKTALISSAHSFSFDLLNKKANKLAHFILENNPTGTKFIALFLDRSCDTIISILAILKLGFAYVPIDPTYPDERIRYILDDTQANLLICHDKYRSRLKKLFSEYKSLKLLSIDDTEIKNKVCIMSEENQSIATQSKELAYIIYTSGTTGKPKGVMVRHDGVVNLFYALTKQYGLNINKHESILLFSNYIFDASVEQIMLAILNGHTLVIPTDELLLDTESLYAYLNKHCVTHIHLPPLLLDRYDFTALKHTRRIIVGGDTLKLEHYKMISKLKSKLMIVNEYGPTETTITAINNCINNDDISIGKPITNTFAYILDSNLKLLPIGAIGELYIGGAGVTAGYLNKPNLTEHHFVINPFNTNEKLYRTGDFARWLESGNIEFIGRRDFQIKLRGYRIELGEIETALSDHSYVNSCVVISFSKLSDDKPENKLTNYLVAYYVADNPIPDKDLERHLESKIPKYMLPTRYIHLNQLPLTLTGKLDRKALPLPSIAVDTAHVAPRNELEKAICDIWADVLALPHNSIGIEDDFFYLGGDSIISIQLVSRLRQLLNLNVTVKDIFELRTISRLQNIFSQDATSVVIQTERGPLSGDVPLLPIQEWFFEQTFNKPGHFNQAFIIKTPELNVERLQKSFNKLFDHHDAFRLRYKKGLQYYDTNATPPKLNIVDIKKEEKFDLTQCQSDFNLVSGPMAAITYIYGYDDMSARIHIACHHLLIDSVSWRILCEDLHSLYHDKDLKEKASSYRQWSHTLQHYSEIYTKEKDYWADILADQQPIETATTAALQQHTLSLDADLSKLLLQAAHRAYHTEINDILLTALTVSLAKLNKRPTHHIILEGHGREEIDSTIDISRTMGWFTTLYPVRLVSTDNIVDTLKATKEMLRKIPKHGLSYGMLIGYGNSNQPLPRISFNYLGQFDSRPREHEHSWQIVNEDVGQTVSCSNNNQYLLNINAQTIDDCFQWTVESVLPPEKTTEFNELFKENLVELINHTASLSRTHITPSDVKHVVNQDTIGILEKEIEIENIYPANSLQQGFIYHALSQGNIDDAYIVQNIWHYNNAISTEKLKEAWSQAQDKYGTLRLRFAWNEKPIQIISTKGRLDWRHMDLSHLNNEEFMNEIKFIQEKDRLEPFTLSSDSLFRVYLFKENNNSFHCLFSHHHAILDGWSIPILRSEVHRIYQSICNNKKENIIRDYTYQNTQAYLQAHKNDNVNFWKEYLNFENTHHNLDGLLKKHIREKELRLHNYKHIRSPESRTLTLDGEAYAHLKKLARKEGVTINAILQFVWHKILSIYSGSTITIVGTTFSGRNIPIDNIEHSIGLHINTLPLLVAHKCHEKISVIELIRKLQDDINVIQTKTNIDLAGLQHEGERLFDSLFILDSYPSKNDGKTDLMVTNSSSIEKIDYPLCISAGENPDKLFFTIQYASELISKNTVDDLLVLTKRLLSLISKNPDIKIDQLRYIENNSINHDHVTCKYPATKTIADLFEEQAQATPHNVAVVYKETSLSYQELNDKANALAHYILQTTNAKPKPNTFIALFLDRSEHLLISILAALKAGLAYVPIDPSYPEERVGYMLKDVDPICLITETDHQNRLSNLTNKKLIDVRNISMTLTDRIKNPTRSIKSTDIAYVIYTSGTTGTPKGVKVKHQSVISLKYSLTELYALGEKNNRENILLFANYIFDASVEQIVLALLNGHSLIIADTKMLLDTDTLYPYLNKHQVTHIHIPPLFLERYNFEKLHHLKRIISGGDILKQEYLSQLKTHSPNVAFINEYGPTETTVTSIVNTNVTTDDLSIGRPIANTTAYILDQYMVPVPIGAVGELYIGGIGVSEGYLNREKLTAEYFIDDPFSPGGKLYKTGDLVRHLASGNIEYIGRYDSQIKLRGYRIEMGDIEAAVLSHKEITQCAVNMLKSLICYYVSDQPICEDELRSHLLSKLPEYMVPVIFTHLKELPLTLSGKLDRKALPEPIPTSKPDNRPKTAFEKKICTIWEEVLGLKANQVSLSDDFFRLGGDSIVSIQLVSRLRQHLNLSLSVKNIFEHRTIAALSRYITHHSIADTNNLITERGKLSGEVPMLPIQKWFFSNNFPVPNHYNQAFIIKTPCLNVKRLEQAIQLIEMRHDAFRLRYKENNQYYDSNAQPLTLRTARIHDIDEADLTQWQANFDLETGPVTSFTYIDGYVDNSARIHIACHHLIIDAVSWRILCHDLQQGYMNGELPDKMSSFRQWSCKLEQYAKDIKNERSYWDNILDDYYPYYKKLSQKHCSKFNLDTTSTQLLLKEAHSTYNTKINDLLLTALSLSLAELDKKTTHHVVVEGHGREEIEKTIDISETLGWFTTLYPVRLDVHENIDDTLKSVKNNLNSIPQNGLGYGILIENKMSKLPEISFNYLGQLDQIDSKNDKSWRIVNENVGKTVSEKNIISYVLNINAYIINSQFKCDIESFLSENQTEKFNHLFKINLNKLIQHCISRKRSYLIAGDLDFILTQNEIDDLQKDKEIESIYYANSLQEGFIYHALSQTKTDDAYIVQALWTYDTAIDSEKLKQAWQLAVRKYPALRLRFSWEDKILQLIDKEGKTDYRFFDLSHLNKEKFKETLTLTQLQDREESFNLQAGGLFRIYLFKESDARYHCLFSNHHAILDGWSNPLLFNTVHTIYKALTSNKIVTEASDKSYQLTQTYIQTHKNDHLDYWKKELQDVEGHADLNGLLRPEARALSYRINEHKHVEQPKVESICIDGTNYTKLNDLTQKQAVTINAILQYAWHKTISIYSRSEQTIVGVTFSGRNLPIDNIEYSVGLYINTLPIVTKHPNDDNTTLIDKIKLLQNKINEIQTKTTTDLASLQKDGKRLFDSLFVYDSYPSQNNSENDLSITYMDNFEKVDYPLAVVATNIDKLIKIDIQYAGELFDTKTIKSILEVLKHLALQIINHPSLPIYKLSYLNEERHKQLVYDWNKTEQTFPTEKSVAFLFENQVEKTPLNTAIISENRRMSYSILNERANQLAHYLIQLHKITTDDIVMILIDRDIEFLIIMLAIFKAGAAYLPIDPIMPADRIEAILEESSPCLIISEQKYKGLTSNLKLDNTALCYIDEVQTKDFSTHNLNLTISPNALAYLIFTSGSTGKPKGAMIEYRGMINHLYIKITDLALTENDRVAQTASQSFDVSVWQFMIAVLAGSATVVFKGTNAWEPEGLLNIIEKENITIFETVPSHMHAILPEIEGNPETADKLKSLRWLIINGEPLPSEICQQWFAIHPNIPIINAYGPTECSDDVTHYKIYSDRLENESRIMPISGTLANTQIYITDSHLTPLPLGAIGELCIGGIGVGRGYLNREDLTNEKFVANPFKQTLNNNATSSKLYKTGDLVRYLMNGEIEYISRKDFQVKIRGYRIELGEIENTLCSHDAIEQCVVIAETQENDKEDTGIKHLVAYYTSLKSVSHENLMAFLGEKLPEYMVPTIYMHLDEFPLTLSGKLNRNALPKPKLTNTHTYIPPKTHLHKIVCGVWAEILGIDKKAISLHDDFFLLGGNSILSIRLVSKLNNILSTQIKIADIFSTRTVKGLSLKIEELEGEHKTIVKLSISKNMKLPCLFMIHPGAGGCEAYTSLANILKGHFNCYGVDSYNLYHDKKIENLHELAEYYLQSIDEIMQISNQTDYHILGWSLGGQIALQIASILERREITNIKLYLLDAILDDDHMTKLRRSVNIEQLKKEYLHYAQQMGYHKSYKEKIISNMSTEAGLIKQKISHCLEYTDVLLFKAMLQDPTITLENLKKIYNYSLKKEYNNIDQVVSKPISLVQLHNVCHSNILESEMLLHKHILNHSGTKNIDMQKRISAHDTQKVEV